MRRYLKRTTKLVITRTLKSDIYGQGQTFDTTYDKALSNNDFSSDAGTVNVSYEIHPSEYKNFDQLGVTIHKNEYGLYLDKPEIPCNQTIFKDGKIVTTDDLGEIKSA